jgi:ABC-type cobalamin transport system ATPase subunit
LHVAVGAGATVVVASHERERATALADRSVLVVGGQVLASPGAAAVGAGVVPGERTAAGVAPC